jgi:branched-subunit amino acid transport protein
MKEKYFSLRIIAWFVKLIAYICLAIAILEAIVSYVVYNNLSERFTTEFPFLSDISKGLYTIFGVNSIILVIGGFISFILISAWAERIRFMIDIEKNSRNTNDTLNKILSTLEKEFSKKEKTN